MHFSNIDYSSERGMQTPFGTSEAQEVSRPSISPEPSSARPPQGANKPDSTSTNYSEQNKSPLEDAGTAPPPLENNLLASASSLSDLSPFAHAPPLAPSLSSSLAGSTVSSAVQSDPKSQKSSRSGQSIASAPIETPEEAVAAALAAAAAAKIDPTSSQQRSLPVQPPSPFLEGILPAGSEDIFHQHPLAFNLFPVPEGPKEGQSTSTDVSTPQFTSKLPREKQEQLLQHLFPPSSAASGGGGPRAATTTTTTPITSTAGGHLPGRVDHHHHLKTSISSPPPPPPIVYAHPSGIPKQGSSFTNSVSSSPPSPAAATAGVAATGGAFSYLGSNPPTPPFTLGGVQLTPEQLQKAALQALQSGQTYASRTRGEIANPLLAYQQPLQQYPAAMGNLNHPLYLHDAALQALQQQQASTAAAARQSSPPSRSDSWGQFGGARSNPPSIISTTPSARRSLEMPFLGAPSAAALLPTYGAPAGDFEGSSAHQSFFPAARYSLSKDSGSGNGGSVPSQRVAQPVTAEQSAAALLQRVQLSTKNFAKVRALLNTGGKFTNEPDTGNLTYTGGEVRLVSLPEGCSFAQLVAVLAKTDRPGLGSTGATILKASSTRLTSPASKETSATTTIPTTAAQTISAATAAVSALVAAQEVAAAAATDANPNATLDAESYATYAMRVARTHCLLRYQLPSDPSIYVDIVDDEDVSLMFEEIAELRAFGGLFGNSGRSSGGAPSKLRLFVQWIAPPLGVLLPTSAAVAAVTANNHNTIDYIERSDQFFNPMYYGSFNGIDNNTISSGGEEGSGSDGGGGGGGGALTTTTTAGDEKYYSAGESTVAIAPRNNKTTKNSLTNNQLTNIHHPGQQQQHVHIAHQSASDLRLAAVRTDQLEIIPASEVTLLELLGTGTFGDMYAGKWRECTVAVKCFNPSAVGLNYGSQDAWLAFLHDANSAAALRHPSLVEVYGIVLPGAQDQRAMQHEVQQRSESLDLALKAAGGLLGNADNGLMIDSKMSGRRTSWDFGALSNSVRSSSTPVPAAFGFSSPPAVAGGGGRGGGNFSTGGIQRLPGPCMSTPAMVMEYVSGRSLQGAIKRKEDAVAGVLARILYALDVAKGMAYLHHRGISHYDLKSTNVLIGWRNMRPAAKIAGYGLSTRKTSLQTYTPGVSMSPSVFPWMAPEILRCPEKVSHKVDIFSFGIILWELWALQGPYEGMDMKKVVSLAVNTDSEVRPEVPPPGNPSEPASGWKELVVECWAEDPEKRPEFVEIEKRLTKMAKEVKSFQRKSASGRRGGGGGGKEVGEKGVEDEKQSVGGGGDVAAK